MTARPSLYLSPAAGMDQPTEILSACHERMERTLALLERLALHLNGPAGADAAAQEAARDILRYFDLAVPHHHLDEELHLVPALRRCGHAELADRLLAEHLTLTRAFEFIRPRLTALRDHGRRPATDDWGRFAALYRRHIELEDSLVYPRSFSSLHEADRKAMGREMARRRRIPASAPESDALEPR